MMRTHVRVEVGNRGAQNVPPCKVKFTEEVFLFFKMSQIFRNAIRVYDVKYSQIINT